ncbi:DUF6497 family protein [Pacificoceanicola onchidii]|uniref:DUF6497 family protein n=1 Tax=Pacificoceanicola onchidii TaxID=2562685 RepID=UPI0023EF50DC|nr:DUF6497 family protein [Pacificoceanicola onchidii]
MSALVRNTLPGAPGTGAAPTGGPTWWGRGCASIIAALMIWGGGVAAETQPMLDVPSGLKVSFHDMLWDEPGSGLTYRFRFLAPDIAAEETDYQSVAADMDKLCNDYAIPRLAQTGPQPSRIVITLMSEPVEFGVMTPEVTQFFESYSVEDTLCIWEAF